MNYKITFNPVTRTFRVFRRTWDGWARIHHPYGKVLRTREHAVNFLNVYKRRRRAVACPCSTVEYFN